MIYTYHGMISRMKLMKFSKTWSKRIGSGEFEEHIEIRICLDNSV